MCDTLIHPNGVKFRFQHKTDLSCEFMDVDGAAELLEICCMGVRVGSTGGIETNCYYLPQLQGKTPTESNRKQIYTLLSGCAERSNPTARTMIQNLLESPHISTLDFSQSARADSKCSLRLVFHLDQQGAEQLNTLLPIPQLLSADQFMRRQLQKASSFIRSMPFICGLSMNLEDGTINEYKLYYTILEYTENSELGSYNPDLENCVLQTLLTEQPITPAVRKQLTVCDTLARKIGGQVCMIGMNINGTGTETKLYYDFPHTTTETMAEDCIAGLLNEQVSQAQAQDWIARAYQNGLFFKHLSVSFTNARYNFYFYPNFSTPTAYNPIYYVKN